MQLDPDMAAVAAALAAGGPVDLDTVPPAMMRAAVEAQPMPVRSTPLARVEDLTIPGPAGPMRARLYVPRDGAPLTVFLHGGGWVLCSIDTHDALCRALAQASGSALLSVDYRLAPEHPFPAAIDDVEAAMVWASAAAPSLGCQAGPIALAGDSAGANLAAAAALAAVERGVSLAHLTLFYPAMDPSCQSDSHKTFAEAPILSSTDMQWFWRQYLSRPADAEDPRASPLRATDLSHLPSTTIVLAGCDPLRSEGEAFGAALARAKVPVEVRTFEGVCHGFASMVGIIAKTDDALAFAGGRLADALR
jgi:acetyl esterase